MCNTCSSWGFSATKTVGNIPKEISRYVYFFIKKEEDWITGKVLSVKYQLSILSGRLEIPLIPNLINLN